MYRNEPLNQGKYPIFSGEKPAADFAFVCPIRYNCPRTQLQDTTFSADLNHDGIAEQVVVNPDQQLINVYTERSIALPVKDWVSDNARESYHLCELDGEAYLLRYCVPTADYAHALSSLAWELNEFDKHDNLTLTQTDEVSFSLAQAEYHFDTQAIYAFLQSLVDQSSNWENTDYWEDWMPVWVTNEEGKKGMFLRGSSPWVNSWQATVQMLEMDSHGQPTKPYLVIITYDMMDSGQNHYAYEETLQCQQNKNTWQVIDCTVTVDYLPPEFYEAVQTIYQNVLHGHDTWRLDPEQVAMAFVHVAPERLTRKSCIPDA